MDKNKLKSSVEKITMPPDMEQRIIEKCRIQAEINERPRIRQSEYTQHVSGVEKARPKRSIIRFVSTAAACAFIALSVGTAMRLIDLTTGKTPAASSSIVGTADETIIPTPEPPISDSPVSSLDTPGNVKDTLEKFMSSELSILNPCYFTDNVLTPSDIPATVTIIGTNSYLSNYSSLVVADELKNALSTFFSNNDLTGKNWSSYSMTDISDMLYKNAYILASFEENNFSYLAITGSTMFLLCGDLKKIENYGECTELTCFSAPISYNGEFLKLCDIFSSYGLEKKTLGEHFCFEESEEDQIHGDPNFNFPSLTSFYDNGLNVSYTTNSKERSLGRDDCYLIDQLLVKYSDAIEPLAKEKETMDPELVISIENDLKIKFYANFYFCIMYDNNYENNVKWYKFYDISTQITSILFTGSPDARPEYQAPIDLTQIIPFGNIQLYINDPTTGSASMDVDNIAVNRMLYGYNWEEKADTSNPPEYIEKEATKSGLRYYFKVQSDLDRYKEMIFFANGYVRYEVTDYYGKNIDLKWYDMHDTPILSDFEKLTAVYGPPTPIT